MAPSQSEYLALHSCFDKAQHSDHSGHGVQLAIDPAGVRCTGGIRSSGVLPAER